MNAIQLIPLTGLPEVQPHAELAALLVTALQAGAVDRHTPPVLVVAQKIVSKAENRYVDLERVEVTARARELAQITGKDARLLTLVLAESSDVLRAVPGVIIVRHRLGYVMANAGIDQSNIPMAGRDLALLLPEDPHASAQRLLADLRAQGCPLAGVIISDSFGRPWREGVVNVALASAGLPALIDRRNSLDRHGRTLQITQVAYADAIAAAAGLVMGEGQEGVPAVLVQGANTQAPEVDCRALLRPSAQDLFQ